MLNKKYLSQIRRQLHGYAKVRLEIIQQSEEAIHHAKRAIFALHRGDKKAAKQKLAEAETILNELNSKHKKGAKMQTEGAYRAALEEYVEARLLFQFLENNKIGQLKNLPVENEVYLAGLCDVPGELLRYAIKSATNRDIKMVKKCAEMAQEIIGELTEFNLTSYLRTKFDQAKQAVRKIEEIVYEVSLRK